MKTINPRRIKGLLLFSALVLMVPILPLLAKTIPPGLVCISTPAYAPARSFNPLPGRYSYTVSWNGIPAGSIELELDRQGDDYKIHASARTAKGIDLVYKLRYESHAVLAADTLKPKKSVSIVRANSREKTTELEFLPDGEIRSTRKNHHGKVKTIQFDSDNLTLDPYSAAFLALSQDWEVGQSRQFDLFNGKSRYLIEFTALEKTELTINEKRQAAIVLVPSIQKLNDTDDENEKKLRQARIYISTGHPKKILKLSSDLLFGSVNAEMVGFTPFQNNTPPSMMDQEDTIDRDKGKTPSMVIATNFLVPTAGVLSLYTLFQTFYI